jgi:hypothetical protein
MKLGNNEMYLKTSTKGRENMISIPLIELHEIGIAMDHFLESIPLKNRVIFIRRYWFCDTYAEIASRYGMKERKVKRIIQDTRKELCAYLDKPWGSFGINQVDYTFIREAEADCTLREGSKYIIGYSSMLNNILEILFERFLSFPKHA